MGVIFGIDEAGLGCLAGPLYIAAVAFDDDQILPASIKDSKKVTDIDAVRKQVGLRAAACLVAEVSAGHIDSSGVWRAWEVTMQSLLRQILDGPWEVTRTVVDGTRIVPGYTWADYVKGADATVPAVSAASIVAKHAQLAAMRRLHIHFPDYGFEQHHGYPTKQHKARLDEFGPSEVHRKSYAPVRRLLENRND